MSDRRPHPILPFLAGAALAVAAMLAVPQLTGAGRQTEGAADSAAPPMLGFAEPEPAVMQRPLLPLGLPETGGDTIGLILTGNATGNGGLIVLGADTLRQAGATAWVRHRQMTKGQGVAAVTLTLGLAAGNWKDFALLVRDGEVIERLRCWQCDTRSPDFQGADLGRLEEAGIPVDPLHQSFRSQAEFETAQAQARSNPMAWIDRTVQFGRSGTEDAPFWVLNTWERVHR